MQALLINNRGGDTSLWEMTLISSGWVRGLCPFILTIGKGGRGKTYLHPNLSAAQLLLTGWVGFGGGDGEWLLP